MVALAVLVAPLVVVAVVGLWGVFVLGDVIFGGILLVAAAIGVALIVAEARS